MPGDRLTDRALNRATLARQLLLERTPMAPGEAVAHLVGMQAQEPFDPYLGLWSRLVDFDPVALGAGLEDRSLVRIVAMRGTIHLLTAVDAATLRPLTQPVLDQEIQRHPEFSPSLEGVDLTAPLAFAEQVMADEPRTTKQLRAVLAERYPDHDAAAVAYAARCYLPLVQVPPRGVWGKAKAVTLAPLTAWTGVPLDPAPSIDDAVIRYLRSYGPATPADAATWSRLTGMAEVFERLRPRLRTFRDERGRELFDLPDAPRPAPDVEAPVRVLPEYDNVLLSHKDRRRFGTGAQGAFAQAKRPFKGTVLVDGEVGAIWHREVDRDTGAVTVAAGHLPLRPRVRAAVERALLAAGRFLHPDATRVDVRLEVVEPT